MAAAFTITFDPSLTDPISQVRQFVGDTDPNDPQVPDQTITAYLQKYGPLKSAALIASDLAAKFTRLAAVTKVDDQEMDYSKLAQAYADLSKRLEGRTDEMPGADANAQPTGGGIIVTGGRRRGWMPSGWAG